MSQTVETCAHVTPTLQTVVQVNFGPRLLARKCCVRADAVIHLCQQSLWRALREPWLSSHQLPTQFVRCQSATFSISRPLGLAKETLL